MGGYIQRERHTEEDKHLSMSWLAYPGSGFAAVTYVDSGLASFFLRELLRESLSSI